MNKIQAVGPLDSYLMLEEGFLINRYSMYLVNNRFCGADGVISKSHALSVAGTQFKPHWFQPLPLIVPGMANNRGAPVLQNNLLFYRALYIPTEPI